MPLLSNSHVKSQVDRYLDEYFDRQILPARAYGSSYQELMKNLKQFVLRGGKRLRPYLIYLSFSAANDSETLPAVQVLAASELLHAALLIHDDIIDHDDRRYGGPNITGHYRDRYGAGAESIALLAGDITLGMVFDLLSGDHLPASQKINVIQLLTAQFRQVQAGQYMDTVPGALPNKRLEDILNVHRYKTASYTTTGPLQIGLQLAAANPAGPMTAAFAKYGEALGLLVGLTDDLLGMFGDELVTGKPNCSDLHEGKPTVMFFYARELLAGPEAKLFNSLIGRPHREGEDLAKLRRALSQCGAQARTEALAADYAARAKQALAELDGSAIEILRQLPEHILSRRH